MRIQSYRSATLAATKYLSARSDMLLSDKISLAADWMVDYVCGVQVFKRNGMDLIMKMDISLTEALCGMKKTVQTLDDRTLVMQTVPGRLFLFVLISLIPIFLEAVLRIRKTLMRTRILLVTLMRIRILPFTLMRIGPRI
jgi:hypothetical protein